MNGKRRSSTGLPKDQTRLRIEQMEAEREERRRLMQERKKERAAEEQRNIAAGNPGDVDFIGLVRKWREEHRDDAEAHDTDDSYGHPRICICVRKRPMSDKERKKNDHDSITCLHPTVWVHSAKFQVDGITKYLDHTSFRFDHAFDESVSTEDVYRHCAMPLLDFVCSGTGGRATVFAYGQTGSGKTYTMNGIQIILCQDLFLLLEEGDADEGVCSSHDTVVKVSFFEIYAGHIQDLLNNRNKCSMLEDGNGEIVIKGLEEFEANDPFQFLDLVETGNRARTTHATEANDTSSRSHAICQIFLRDKFTSELRGKLSLVDLAGSERGTDTKSHNAQRRSESQDINTSLLALKECIRALDMNKSGTKHVPYRQSKLTLILKDCFTSENAKTTMIATISPGASAADHSINTLRYANRIKEKKVGDKVNPKSGDKSRLLAIEEKETSLYEAHITTPPRHTEPRSQPGFTVDQNEEDELMRTMQSLFEQEEVVLDVMMRNIKEDADFLREEGAMLQTLRNDQVDDEVFDMYALRMSSILDRKMQMIMSLQDEVDVLRTHLHRT